jgi:hypothetical protein
MSMAYGLKFNRFSMVLMLASASPALAFGPGEAAGGRRPDPTARTAPGNADYQVVIWYRRDDPLGTFQEQAYDARKGEYTKAVEDWVRDTRARYPAYLVLVRAVDLTRERGESEKLKVGSVIYRELMIAAAATGIFLGAPTNISISAAPSASQGQTPRSDRLPASDRSFLNSAPKTYVNPVNPRTRTP